MALLTDGTPSDIAFLQAYESSIADLAAREQINLDLKMRVAADRVSSDISSFLRGRKQNGLHNSFDLVNVLVTPLLKQWHAATSLALIYSDAFGNQRNERFQIKADRYARESLTARLAYFEAGVALVTEPIPKCEQPEIMLATGATDTIWMSAALVNMSSTEGEPSGPTVIGIHTGATVQLREFRNRGSWRWNIYLGNKPDQLALQNGTPIPAGSSWTYQGTLDPDGPAPQGGQTADVILADDRRLLRG